MILRRVLVANRGEIAVRVLRTCQRLGIETVLAVSDADADSVPARLADHTIRIGPVSAAESYLNTEAVVAAAVAAGADAIHPGYGFLSENPRLARACEAAGIVFIGPSADVLKAAGDKLAARNHAVAAGLPVLPGGLVAATGAGAGGRRRRGRGGRGLDAGAGPRRGRGQAGRAIGYPVLVKAAGGGGGRGLRVVSDPGRLAEAVAVASAEAQAAFSDPRVYLERYVSPARHVEVQLLGDGENVIHLGDRDCSVQRRYQKLIEEAPAPQLGETLRVGMRAAAVALGLHLKYQGLGTVEFLVDAERAAFWFLEVNARIQVEHPVTEAVTGLDLVAEQIAIAEGRGLRLAQADVCLRGHAIECRINAEDPAAGFRPSPGTVTSAVFPAGPGIRVDTHIQAGSAVPPQYDSLLAKLIVSGAEPGAGAGPAARRAGPVRARRGGDHRGDARGAGRRRRSSPRAVSPPTISHGGWGGKPGPLGIKMTYLELTDVSLRDGNQSLWGATGLRTEHILQIAPVLNRVGFRALDFMSSTAMGVAVRTHREDPWQRIRLTRAAVPDAHLQFIGTGLRFISWERAHPEVLRLVYDRLVAAGISRFVVLDPTHDMDAVRASARTIRQAGGTEIIMALTYTISAVHDDAFYAGIAGQAAASPYIDRAYLKDPAGLLTPERARTLIPAVRARLGGKPLELHAHCTIGLSPLVYLTAPDLGVEVLQTGCGALADGSSLPDAERVVANLRELGHTVDVDDRLLARAARYFDRLAAAESLPSGQPRPYDAAFTRHQLAGGVLTTLRRQLAELGLEAKFGAVMEEVSRVRAELGYPIMVTPFPQMVMGQALSNVLGDERYGVVPDQVIRYVLGSFGKPTAPVEPWVLDRILDRPRARELAAEPPPLSVAELRGQLPRGISDEELLLRFAMPAGEVDAMLAAAPAARHYTPEAQPVLRLLRELGARPPVRRLVVDKPGFRLSLSGPGGPADA